MAKKIQIKASDGTNLLLNAIYPVGSIYMSVNSTSPSTLFGGTWEQIKDRFLLASGSTYSSGNTGGEATHKLTVSEMPNHNHEMYTFKQTSTEEYTKKYAPTTSQGWWNTVDDNLGAVGGGQAHNNMPPYLVVNVWKRTA